MDIELIMLLVDVAKLVDALVTNSLEIIDVDDETPACSKYKDSNRISSCQLREGEIVYDHR